MPSFTRITHFVRNALIAAALSLGAGAAFANDADPVVYRAESGFEDSVFALESAIIDRGLVIDYRSFIGEMLARTGADVGSDVQVFENAQIFLFCSAVLSRKMMEEDPANVSLCPWGVFVYALPGESDASHVGFRRLVSGGATEGAKQEIEALLDEIAREAAGVE